MNTIKKSIALFYLFLIKNRYLSRLVFLLTLFQNKTKVNQILILATITKTGTHYIRFLLAYYLKITYFKNNGLDLNEIKSQDDLVDEYFPNSWHTAYRLLRNKIKPKSYLRYLNLYDIPRSHMSYRKTEWSGTKIIHTYRNILDQVVVVWETKYRCNYELYEEYSNIWSLFLDTVEDLVKQEDSFALLNSNNRVNSLRISFEQLFNNPIESLKLILMWLGLEPDIDACKMAVNLTQKSESVLVGGGEKWHRYPHGKIDQNYLKNFIESNKKTGAIGSHKNYFTSDEIIKAKKIIDSYRKASV
jgi:hypothetical protein